MGDFWGNVSALVAIQWSDGQCSTLRIAELSGKDLVGTGELVSDPGEDVVHARHLVVVVTYVHLNRQADLVQVAQAGGGASAFPGATQPGEEQAARMEMMAMTTSNSMRVKAARDG